MQRRRFLKVAAASTAGLAGLGAYGWYTLLPPRRSRRLASVPELAAELVDGLSDEARARACVPYDHPLRQYHNRGVKGGGAPVWGGLFTRAQRGLLTDLFHAGLSQAGRARVTNQFFVNWPGVHLMNVLVCGDPRTGPFQLVLSGPHLNLRLGGRSREGAAFGGPLVYGDQRGNGRRGLPGNLYRYQLEAGTRLLESLTPAERQRAILPAAPVQTQIELRGSAGAFDGVPLAEASPASRRRAEQVVAGILENWPDADVDHARACLAANGGVGALSAAWYADGRSGDGPYQVFRLEGPAAVFHFRGWPHLHAFLNVGEDGDAPLSVGELLGTNPRALAGDDVRALFEAALQATTGADVGYYPRESVVGRLRAGPIRTGDVYTLESWQNRVALCEVDGATLAAPLAEALRRRGEAPDPARTYTVATTSYTAAEQAAEHLGRVRSVEPGEPVRDAVVAHLRENGFSAGS